MVAQHASSSPAPTSLSSLVATTSAMAPFLAIMCYIVAWMAMGFKQERWIEISFNSVGYVLSMYGLYGLFETSQWNKDRKSHEMDVKFIMKCSFFAIMSVLFFSTVVFSFDRFVQGLLIFCMIMFTIFYVAFVWYYDFKFEQKCLDRLKFKSATISVINKNFADDKRPLVVKEDRDVFNI